MLSDDTIPEIPNYDPPAIEQVLEAEDLELEVQYAGNPSFG